MALTGLSTNTFSYEGNVKLTFLRKDKTRGKSFILKNKGTTFLGTLLSKSLIRDYKIEEQNKPYKLGFVASGNFNLLKNTVPFSGIVYGDNVVLPPSLDTEDVIGKVQLSAIIQSKDIVGVSGINNFRLIMYDRLSNELAYIEDDENQTLKNIYGALKNQEVLVEWYMLFCNRTIVKG